RSRPAPVLRPVFAPAGEPVHTVQQLFMQSHRIQPTFGPRALMAAAAAVAAALLSPKAAPAEDVSAPAILQWFDGTWWTMERRAADVFQAGYGAIWAPPPGRAESSNF